MKEAGESILFATFLITQKIIGISVFYCLNKRVPKTCRMTKFAIFIRYIYKEIWGVFWCESTKVLVELVKQQEIRFNFPSLFFLVGLDLNLLVVVVRKPDATKNGLYQLTLWWGMVTDSPSQIVAIAQTKHSTVGENLNGHAQGKKVH